MRAARQAKQGVELDRNFAGELVNGAGYLCNKWLLVRHCSPQYYEGKPAGKREGLFKLTSWMDVKLFEKSDGNCTKTYIARCATGGIVVQNTCRDFFLDHRSLEGPVWRRSRKTDVRNNETLTMLEDEPGLQILPGGSVAWEVVDPRKGIELKSITERQEGPDQWKGLKGCYCCKHRYRMYAGVHPVTEEQDPFSASAGHRAFHDDECMLAWKLVRAEPEAGSHSVLDYANLFSLRVTQPVMCSMTCPFRSDAFPENKFSLMKLK